MNDNNKMNSHVAQLALLTHAVQYVPSNRSISYYKQFWAQPGVTLPDNPDKVSTSALAPNKSISLFIEKEWDRPGFQDWFLNPHWDKEESHRLILMGMHRLGEILQDSEDEGTVISAAKEAREIWSRLNKVDDKKFVDEDLYNMSQQELEEYIRRNTNIINAITK